MCAMEHGFTTSCGTCKKPENLGQRDPEAVDDAPVGGTVPVPECRAAVGRRAAPAPAPQAPAISGWRTGRIDRSFPILLRPVMAPLPRVPVHVKEAPRVRLLLPYRVRLRSRVRVRPGKIARDF